MLMLLVGLIISIICEGSDESARDTKDWAKKMSDLFRFVF